MRKADMLWIRKGRDTELKHPRCPSWWWWDLCILGFPGGSAGKASTCSAGDLGLIPGLGRFPCRRERRPPPVFWPGEFHGLDGSWGHTESVTTERASLSLDAYYGFPGSSDGKESDCNAELGSIPGSGRSPAEGNGNSFQYSCLENPMDRGAWQATVCGIARVGHDLATTPPPPPL